MIIMGLGKYKGILDIKLYKKNQEQKIEYIKGILSDKNIPYVEDDYGNIYSIRFDKKPLFSAHLDTVGESYVDKKLVISKEKLSRPGYILGADDAAGLNLILNHVESINFAFFKDEEIGCLGSSHAMKDLFFTELLKMCSFVVVLDRRNGGDVLGNKHGYCNEELDEKILNVLEYGKSVKGILCDLDSIQSTLQGVNISVGYYNAHSNSEYLDLKEFARINNKILELNEIEIEPTGYDKPAPIYSGIYGGSYMLENDYYEKYVCEVCGKKSWSHMSTVAGVTLCSECVEDYCTLKLF
jgi:hypothetical protein